MLLKSLKSKLLLAVLALVLLSGLLLTLLVTQRYSKALQEAMRGQAENLAHSLALDAADKILINDLVGLQKMLDQQRRSHPAAAYAFILREGEVLAHTFEQGVPLELMGANQPLSPREPGFRPVVSTRGENFLDTAWPIFEGKAGVLRLGISEDLYGRQVARLWLEIALFTLGVLLVALLGSLIFVRRITRPLAALVAATRDIDRGQAQVRVPVEGQDEIATLAASFNHMVARQEEYTHRLEEQALELERAHGQTRAACQIVREISALGTLEEMRAFLLGKLKETITCQGLVLLAFNVEQDTLFVLSDQGVKTFKDLQALKAVKKTLGAHKKVSYSRQGWLRPPLLPGDFPTAAPQALIPLHGEQISGAVVIACSEDCPRDFEGLEWVNLILRQNAGALRRALLHEEEVSGLKSRVEAAAGFEGLVGKDPRMQVVYKLIEDVAPADATVLIQGESGTGKELVARAIHRLSPRRARPFVVINCSAYPATLLESELFGHEKGAFTGATRLKPGRFELAEGGTVFLDEIGEIPPPAQLKLLRVLQTRHFERVGGEKTLSVDVRVLAATNKDLKQEVKKGLFREDLFYRLNVIPIALPPLRERTNDIPMLAHHFLKRFAAEQGKPLGQFSSEVMRLLLEYSWPGNVRELENTVEHAAVLAKGSQVEVWDLPALLCYAAPRTSPTMADTEITHLLTVLEECGWNKKLAAQRLGISRSTVYALLKRHKVSLSSPTTH